MGFIAFSLTAGRQHPMDFSQCLRAILAILPQMGAEYPGAEKGLSPAGFARP
jgi:hypothetical protein